MPAYLFAIGCTTLAGLDQDYELASDSGASGTGQGASSATGGQGATSATGGQAAISGDGGQSASSAAGGNGGTSGAGGQDAASGDGSLGGEDCGNAADDDGDQMVDCFDTDCSASPSCEGKCADAATLSCNSLLVGQSSGATGSTERLAPPVYECATGLRPGPEYAYRVNGTVGDDVFIAIHGLEADLGIFLVEVAAGAQCEAAQGCRAFGDEFSGTEPEAVGFTVASGRDYFVIVDGWEPAAYSVSVQCSSQSTCRPVRAIQAGQSITSTNAAGSAPNVTDNQDLYSCAAGVHSAPEAAFMFTPTEGGNYEVALTGLSGNLDVFIVAAPDCNTTCLNATSRGVNAASANERFTFPAEANTSYYIVVDGYGTSSFTLSVTKL